MARNRKRRIRANAQASARPFRRGVLVVHGIGKSQPGDTLKMFAHSIEAGVAQAGAVVKADNVTVEDGIPRTVVDIQGSPAVLMMEAHWANALPALNGFDTGRIGRQLLALIRMIPLLLAGALGPRVHEPDLTDLSPSANMSQQFRTLAPMLWRMSTLLGIAIGMSLIISAGVGRPWLGALFALIALAFIVFLGTSKLVGQVRIAALEDDEISPALARIREAIAQIEAESDEVWVIAHSQGGYLTHRVLAADGPNAHPQLKRFTGIASGLRPIHLASAVRSTRWALSGWCTIVASVCMMAFAVLVVSPGGILSASALSVTLGGSLVFLVNPAALLSSVEPMRHIESIQEATQAAIAWTSLDTARIGFIAASLAAMGTAFWVRKGAGAFQAIHGLPPRIRWEELTSPSDFVGSMAVPPLPGRVHQLSLPALRNPIGDHLLSMLLRGPAALRVLISERLIDKQSFATNQTPIRFAPLLDSLHHQSHRTYRLRGLLLGCTVGFTLGFPIVMGSPIIDLVRQPVLLGAYVTVSLAATGISAAWWVIGARRHMRSYNNNTAYSTLPEVSPSYLRWLWISAWVSVGSAFSIAFVSQLTQQGLQPIVGSLMILGLVLLLSACLAEVQVHLPRPLLWLVLTAFPMWTIFSTVRTGGGALEMILIFLFAPGFLLGLGCVALTLVALMKRRTVHNSLALTRPVR